MKKQIIFLLLVLPHLIFSQSRFSKDSIPLEGDEVVFRVEFNDINLNKPEMRKRILYYLSNDFNPYSERLVINEDDKSVCQTKDYFVYSSGMLYTYSVYMRYNLVFDYEDNMCRMAFQNISFIEKEEYDQMREHKTGKSQHKNSGPLVFTAKAIMVDKDYKVIFIKNASDKVTEFALNRINKVVEDIDNILLKKNILQNKNQPKT